jgi:hypothetical protein
MYLNIADEIATMFPAAKFIILVRDPRGTVWSMHTWKDAPSPGIAALIEHIAEKFLMQWRCAQKLGQRAIVVRYEDLCADPEAACRRVCEFLGVPFDTAMIRYGDRPDTRPGYGDRNTLLHASPHTSSIARWQLESQAQEELARRCTAEALTFFGYEELACMALPCAASGTTAAVA